MCDIGGNSKFMLTVIKQSKGGNETVKIECSPQDIVMDVSERC